MRILVEIAYQGNNFLGFSNSTKWSNGTATI